MTKAAEAKPAEAKTFPVKLDKNYRPMGDFMIEEAGELRDPDDIERAKVPAGTTIHLPVDEARNIISKKIAQRNDPIS
jgi:hypothetical protein